MEKIKHLKIPLNEIKLATADKYTWHHDVYKAELGEMPKKKVFIKRIGKKENILKASFIEKIEMLASFEHPSNQVSFLGYCDEESEMILVFEYTFKKNLEYYWDTGCRWAVNLLEDSDLTWQQRIWICLDIAHGLLLTTMISVVEFFEIHPKYSVFLQEHKRLGLPDEDIYLFGVFLFEILTASCNCHQLEEVFSSEIASVTRLKDMTDLRIRNEVAEKSLDTFIEITCKCLTPATTNERPTLEDVIKSFKEVIHIHVKEQFMIPSSVIVTATENFDKKYCIGSGGFGEVYKAKLNLSDIESCYGKKLRSRCDSSTMMHTEGTINTEGIAGTQCYIDPEYEETGRLKKASDIYSFGVVLFEIFSGKLAYDKTYTMQNHKGLASIARKHFKNKTLKKLLDAELADETSKHDLKLKVWADQDSLNVFSNIAYQCLSRSQDKRPTIQAVIQDLKKALQLQVS
ncbi:hypothetical protein E3N88_28550 [Mikania micrantha]|uniref:Protein kinase domain-containing protein n=1 Tax=Mikania micrantha TaxID=192012 RepID=A0A5N6MZS9_9ASTR|nr:hypothetical protein E3N88_28550 [Mikania micrantha]